MIAAAATLPLLSLVFMLHNPARLFLSAIAPYSSSSSIALSISGGVDSMLLLRAYKDSGFEGNVTAVHFDHRTRSADSGGAGPSNKDDADLVARAASCPLSVKVWPYPQPITPTSASEWRREELGKFDVVVTGHHGGDSVESQVLKMSRGASVLNMRGIRSDSVMGGVRYLRPFAGLRKEEVLEEAGRLGVEWNEDPSNSLSKGKRNIIRNELLPLWRTLGDIDSRLEEMGRESEEVRAFVDGLVLESGLLEAGAFRLDRVTYPPTYLHKRALRVYLEGFWPAERKIFEGIWERIEKDGGKGKGWSMDLGGGWMVKRERGGLWVEKSNFDR